MLRAANLDPLTDIYNKRYLIRTLEDAILGSHRHYSELSLLTFDIDHFKRVNDMHGHAAGDFVLKELARVVQEQIASEMVFARYGGAEFSIVLPETTLAGAVAFAETLRRKVFEHVFIFEADSIRVTISLGAALLRGDDGGAGDLLRRADECLHFAKNTGRNRVTSPPDVESGDGAMRSGHRSHHAVLDVDALLEKSLRARPHGHLIAFEIDDEAAVVAHVGSSIYREWFGEIVSGVDQSIGKDDTLATWRERYVIAALHGMTPAAVASTVAAISENWTARLPIESRSVVPRSLRVAMLAPEEIATLGKRALDVLVGRLLTSHARAQTPEDDLPFPVAAPKAAILTRRTAYRRVEALLDAIVAAARFIVAVELAMLRDSVEPELKRRAVALLAKEPIRGQPLAMRAWVSLLWRLADLVADGPIDPVQSTLATLGMAGPLRMSLSAPLARAVALREELTRNTVVSDDAHGGDEGWLHDLLDRLLLGMRPIMQMRLVSVAEIESVDDDEGDHDYALYLHQGPVEHFPIVHERIAASLVKSWCYLLSEKGVRRSLLLSPMVFSATCATCGRVEAYLAEGLTFGPVKSMVHARSVTTNHGGEAKLPGNRRTREFDGLLEKEATSSRPYSDEVTLNYQVSIDGQEKSNQYLTVRIPRESGSLAPPDAPLHAIASPSDRWLPTDELLAIHAAAISIGLPACRNACLGGVNASFVATLKNEDRPDAQQLGDLHTLNTTPPLTDRSVPLHTWLVNACQLAGPRSEVRVLDQARNHVGVRMMSTPIGRP
jgi:diguanylate cyclase (GGDEF)-like protein